MYEPNYRVIFLIMTSSIHIACRYVLCRRFMYKRQIRIEVNNSILQGPILIWRKFIIFAQLAINKDFNACALKRRGR